MNQHATQKKLADESARSVDRVPSSLVSVLFKSRILSATFVVSLLAIVYWSVVASDRYVSEAHVIIQSTDLSSGQGMDFSSVLGNFGGGSGEDQLLLRDYLLSVDMLNKLDERLDLRDHFSDSSRDPLSRMWDKDAPLEWFHSYYLSRVSVEYDGNAGVLIIQAQGYDAQMAHAIASMLVEEGERYMNVMAHRLAQEQVVFLEEQVADLNERVILARQTALDYQNEKGMVSPQGTAENLAGIINALVAKLTELQTQRKTMLSYLRPGSAQLVEIDQKIYAIQKQIRQEKSQLASPEGEALNQRIEEYKRLQLNAEFATDLYKTALISLEKGRIEATRILKKVSIIQYPTSPQYPLQPRRIYNTVVFILAVLLIAGILHLVTAIIRDHRD